MVHYISDYEIVVSAYEHDPPNPLFGFYNISVLPVVRKLIIDKELSVQRLLKKCTTKVVHVCDTMKWCKDLDTIEEYYNFIKKTDRQNIKTTLP